MEWLVMDLKFGGRSCLSSVELNDRKHRSVPRKFLSPSHHTLVVSSRSLHLTQTCPLSLENSSSTAGVRLTGRPLCVFVQQDFVSRACRRTSCCLSFWPVYEKSMIDCSRVDEDVGVEALL